MSEQTLKQKLDALAEFGQIENLYPKIPSYVCNNLERSIELRPYQEEAIKRFLFYFNNYPNKPIPTHLLYHMATGSGKTVLMASLILELYEKGYRNFIFFVNSSNIIKKTKENFLNPLSSKYLFSNKLKFGEKEVKIKEVDNFESLNLSDINIHFTTIQALHTRINTPKENSITLEDFEDKEIVLISDEAHHINADTKKNKLTKTENEEKESWEGTIAKIFKQNQRNLLLEFTATVDLAHSEISNKYKDKIIYEYSLKQFRKDGYSKEVNVIQVDSEAINRAFQAVILSQYRRKIAEKHGLNIKPVILLKSKNIAPSQEFRVEFHKFIDGLTIKDLEQAKQRLDIKPFTTAFKYFEDNKISFENLVKELKKDFSKDNTLDINDTKELEDNQIKVNSLEDKNNEIRIVFAVDKLNEGWDVLNLFDIVRLYDTRDSKAGKAGKTTMSEAQLIGRGARYYPFRIGDDQVAEKRKYDHDLDNELKILEDFYYHSPAISRYIDEIKDALRQTGILEDNRVERELKVKNSFKDTSFYKKGYIFLNKQRKVNREAFESFKDYNLHKNFSYNLKTGNISGEVLYENRRVKGEKRDARTHILKLGEIDNNIIRFAIDSLEFFRFDNIKKYFPKSLTSVKYFIELPKFLSDISVEITGTEDQLNELSNKNKLEIVLNALLEIEGDIKSKTYDFEGEKDFKPKLISDVLKDKILKFSQDSNSSDKETGKGMLDSGNQDFRYIDLKNLDWFVYNDCYGSSEEKYFVKYVFDNEKRIKQTYEEFYLIRNEKLFQIYNFQDGKAFEPDFALFLKKKNSSKELVYQVFIEPKGSHLIEQDKWKENFLKQLEFEQLFQGRDYHIFGLPFYTESNKSEFDKSCKSLLEL
jgi:type III restriction enzyme